MKLDFGLSHGMLSEEFRKAWPYEFGLVYSVTLAKDALATSLQVTNEGKENFEFQVLMHSYLRVEVWTHRYALSAAETVANSNRISPTSVSKTSSPRPTSTRPAMPPRTPRPPMR